MASAKLTQADVDLLATEREQRGSQSRSTSAGSSFSPSTRRALLEANCQAHSQFGFEDFEYPLEIAGVVVKNTFVDSPVDTPTSLDGFFKQRQIHSCPPGTVAAPGSQAPDAQEQASEEEPEPEVLQTPFPSYDVWERTPEPAPVATSGSPEPSPVLLTMPHRPFGQAAPPPPAAWAPCVQPEAAVPPPPMAHAERPHRIVRLADVMAAPQLGSPEAPTIGSLGHKDGACKPCAYFHTRGCESGFACEYCHLCDKKERKRRQKQRHQEAARQLLLQQQEPGSFPLRMGAVVFR